MGKGNGNDTAGNLRVYNTLPSGFRLVNFFDNSLGIDIRNTHSNNKLYDIAIISGIVDFQKLGRISIGDRGSSVDYKLSIEGEELDTEGTDYINLAYKVSIDKSLIFVAFANSNLGLPVNSSLLFSDIKCNSLQIKGFDASKVKYMNSLFYKSSINNLYGYRHWDVASLITMDRAFSFCRIGNGVDLTGWKNRNPGIKLDSAFIEFQGDYHIELA